MLNDGGPICARPVATKKLEQMPQWVKVTNVFKTNSDLPFLKRAGITDLEDTRSEKYSKRLAKLRAIRNYPYRMDILERTLSYEEVTEIFVRVNSLGAKLRSSDLALAQVTAKWHGALKTFQDFEKQCAKAGFDLDLGIHRAALFLRLCFWHSAPLVLAIGAPTYRLRWIIKARTILCSFTTSFPRPFSRALIRRARRMTSLISPSSAATLTGKSATSRRASISHP